MTNAKRTLTLTINPALCHPGFTDENDFGAFVLYEVRDENGVHFGNVGKYSADEKWMGFAKFAEANGFESADPVECAENMMSYIV